MSSPSQRLGVVGCTALLLAAQVAVAVPASASSTSSEVVYAADDNNDGVYGLVLRDLASRKVTTVLPPDLTNQWIYDEPELSPDGGRVAFSTDRDGGDAAVEGLAVVNRDGSGFRRLTTPPASSTTTSDTYSLDVSAAWSPDGTKLLFTRITVTIPADTTAESTVDTALFTVPAAGGTPAPLAGAGNGYTGDWSPDGSRVVFAELADPSASDSGPLVVVNSNGSGGRLVLSGAVGFSPAWSPDGSTVAYATVTARDSDRNRAHDTAQIAVVPVGGGAPRVLAPTKPGTAPSVAEYPAWLPDGQSLVYDLYDYSTGSFPPGDLWAVDKDGVRAGKITATAGDEAQAHVQGPGPQDVVKGIASTYVPVSPQRVLDTRSGVGAPKAVVGPAGTIDVDIRGLQTSPSAVPADATAVVLNVTVTGPTASTDIRAYPAGGSVPNSSNLNVSAGRTVPNLVTVAIGASGAVTLRNSAGNVHLIADIAGYYVPNATGSGFAAVEPSRILDTRKGVGAPTAKVSTQLLDLQVTGTLRTADGNTVTIPGDARAVVLNVTGTGATASTDVRVYPVRAGGTVPTVSNLNLVRGQTAPNLVTVAVGDGGKVRLKNAAGAVDLIADVAGYYSASAPGRFVPVVPSRFLDTRNGIGGAPIPVTAGGTVDVQVGAFRGVPAGVTAAVLNLTGTGVTNSTDVRAYPADASAVPTVSNLNLTTGLTRANAAIVKVGGDGQFRLRNGAGNVHLIADLAGYMVG